MLGVDADDHIFVTKNFDKDTTYDTYTVDRTKWQHFDLDVDMVNRTLTISMGYYEDATLTTLQGYTEVGTFSNFHQADKSTSADTELLTLSYGTSSTKSAVKSLDNFRVVKLSAVTD